MSNIKKSKRGFTLVELLIVIVVIAILAAISVVAYNGIQNRAKTSSGQALASQVSKKAEAFNTIRSSYPANTAGFTHADAPEARLDNAAAVKAYAAGTVTGGVDVVATYDNGNSVVYRSCPSGNAGGLVYYWDFGGNNAQSIRVGGGC